MKNKVYNLDLIGLKCPIPILKLSKKFKEIQTGDIINAKLDDPSSENDINNLCKSIKIRLMATGEQECQGSNPGSTQGRGQAAGAR